MKRVEVPPAILAKIQDRLRDGAGVITVMKEFDLGESTSRRVVREARKVIGCAPRMDKISKEARAGIDKKIDDMARTAIKARSAHNLRLAKDIFTWRPDREGPVGIAFLADIHLGASGTNYAALEKDLEIIEHTPGLYVVIGGDVIDNHIKHLAATIASGMTPGSQWKWCADLLKRLSPRLVAVVGGNHEAWTVAATGYEPLRELAATIATPYDADEIVVRYAVGNQNYLGIVRHKGRFQSSMNPSHAPKQHYRFGDFAFDFCVFCDQHQYTIEPFQAHGLQRWVLRPGSYQERSAFSRARGYPAASPFSPVIILRPDRRDLHGFASIEWGAEMLSGIRAKWLRRHGPMALTSVASSIKKKRSGRRNKKK